jgi:hypothetical protein
MALKARINHPVAIFPEAMHALQALGKVAHNPAVPRRTLLLVELRASQIKAAAFASICTLATSRRVARPTNGCSPSRRGATTPPSTMPNALVEALTRISDREDPVSDETWAEAARHYDEAGSPRSSSTSRVSTRESAQRRRPPGCGRVGVT